MNNNRFFTVELDNASEQTLRVMPTAYLEELHPHEAIAEMQEYIETLEDVLVKKQNSETGHVFKLQGIGSLAFELELVRSFLASFKQAYETMH